MWWISACIQVTCPVHLMLINGLSRVNYFSTLLAGKEDKCFDLAVSDVWFLSCSFIVLGSIWFKCCYPGLTVELGDRMPGGTEQELVPQSTAQCPPQHPELGLPWGATGAELLQRPALC